MGKLTETDFPQVPEGRLKGTQRGQCEHFWAANKRNHGRDGNLYYDNAVIYSYGSHFPIARHVKRGRRKFILFTSRGYSSSTSKHKRDVRHAIQKDAVVFTVPNVRADFKRDHEDNLKWYKDEALVHATKAKRARENKAYLLGCALGLIEEGNRYAEAVGLRKRLGSPTGEDLMEWGAKVQAEAKAEEERREKTREAANAKYLKEWNLKLEKWQAGEDENPGHSPDNLAYVRVSRGKFLQTTMGMTVPLKEVLPVLTAIRGELKQSDTFNIQEWEGALDFEAKLFTIGCHRIQFAEIERAAKAAGL